MGGTPVDYQPAFVIGELAEGEEQGEVSVVEGATCVQKAAPRPGAFQVDGAQGEAQGAVGEGHIVDDATGRAREVLERPQEGALLGARTASRLEVALG